MLRGVRVHNLQSVDLDLPLHRLIVITGVSGAGKSSLAFDTLYAEGQRRYIESFSTYERQFLERLEPPDADRIDHIPAAIAIRRKSGSPSRRATIASATEIYEYLRLLYTHAGTIICPDCRREVRSASPATIARVINSWPSGTRFQVCFPIPGATTAEIPAQLKTFQEAGFKRFVLSGKTLTAQELATAFESLQKSAGVPGSSLNDQILVVVDRLVTGSTSSERLTDSLELAFQNGDGRCAILIRGSMKDDGDGDAPSSILLDGEPWSEWQFNNRLVCAGCQREFLEPEPRLFSFNSPLGACPECHGTGMSSADPSKPCPACHNTRLQPQALAVRVAGKNIAEFCQLTAAEALQFCGQIPVVLSPEQLALTRSILSQISSRLVSFCEVRLNYLTLDRPLQTLSSGEAGRLGLIAALGSNLVNMLYVFDEPTNGLHPRDTETLIKAVLRLRDLGNTVVVVEHDATFIRSADQLVDLGPGAGAAGGRIVFQGLPSEIENCAESVTGAYLAGRLGNQSRSEDTRARPPQPPLRKGGKSVGVLLRMEGVQHHNLRGLDVEFPLGMLCVVTGVSGSGKSSLVLDTLYPALCQALKKDVAPQASGHYAQLSGYENIHDVLLVDQTPISKTPRSNAATCLQIFHEIRRSFAETSEAKLRNYSAAHFSFNAASGGRCPTCRGMGTLAIDMQFLPDVAMTCPDCQGTRFRREILEVKYRGLTIVDVLNLSIREAFPFFRGQSRIQRRLKHLLDVGLDYLLLGQPANTLSGGELQRLKLASFLSRGSQAHTLFLLDEPTAGLHGADVAKLLDSFDTLLGGGHSLIVIEHRLDVIRRADHIIDLGPEAGAEGGRIVAQGNVAEVTSVKESATGQFLSRSSGERGM